MGGDEHPQDLLATTFKSSTMGKGNHTVPGCPTQAKQQSERSPKQVQKAPMLGRANGGVTAWVAVVAIRRGDAHDRGRVGAHTPWGCKCLC